MHKCTFFSENKALDFAIKLAETKIENENLRIESLSNKINFYIVFLTIMIPALTLITKLISTKSYIFKIINPMNFTSFIKLSLLNSTYASIILLLWFLFKTVFFLLKALKPITFMQHNNESIDESISKGALFAKRIYLNDLLTSIKSNTETVNNQFTLLNYVNHNFNYLIFIFLIIVVLLGLLQVVDSTSLSNYL